MKYTIERVLPWKLDDKLVFYICQSVNDTNLKYGNKFKWDKTLIQKFACLGYLAVCRRDGRPVGFLAASIYRSLFDSEIKILRQDLLFAEPKTRAAKFLISDFIDFGKSNANHLLSMIAEHTNIKARSLEQLGFKKLETLYRLEV